MGLEFKTFNTLASRMMSFAKISGLKPIGSGSPAAKAPAAKAPAASPSASSVGGGGQQAGSDKRGVRGKGGGKQQLTHAQIAANDAEAEAKAAEAKARTLRAQADAAEDQARIDNAAKSGASSAVVASPPRPPCARGGGDYVTQAQFKQGIDSLQGEIRNGFTRVFANQSTAAEQQALTNGTLAGFIKMANAGSGFQLSAAPAPVSRQIGNGQREEQSRVCFGQNAGWDDTVNGSNGGAATSFRASSAIEAGRTTVGSQHGGQNGWSDGPRMPQSSEMVVHREAPSEFRSASGGSATAPAPLSLAELMRTIPEAAKGFRGLCGRIISDAAAPGAKAVPLFTAYKVLCAWQMCGGNDDLACALMALTYGKPLSQQRLQPGIATAMRTTDPSLFTEFFRLISVQYPSFVLTYNWKGPSGQEYKTPYGTFSSDQGILYRFIYEHILA